MKRPPQHVLDLAHDLSEATGEHHRITRTRRLGYRISLANPRNVDEAGTLGLLELLGQADRFGASTWAVWAEFDRQPS